MNILSSGVTKLLWLPFLLLQQDGMFASSSLRNQEIVEHKTGTIRGYNADKNFQDSRSGGNDGITKVDSDNVVPSSLSSPLNKSSTEHRSLDILNHIYRINSPKEIGCDGTYSFFLRFDLSVSY